MSRFLKTLSKIGLVELSPEEQARAGRDAPAAQPGSADELEALLAETRQLVGTVEAPRTAPPAAPPPVAPASTPPAPTPPAPPPAPGAATGVTEGRPLAELYAEQALPPSPFPAEKLIRMLDGLSAMPEATRKAAVLAMDAADDDWSIDDALLDAQRKVRALEAARAAVQRQAEHAAAQAQAQVAEQDRYEQEATATIRQQIAEMEALLQAELTKAAEARAQARAAQDAAHQAASREVARLDAEIQRLGHLAHIFGS